MITPSQAKQKQKETINRLNDIFLQDILSRERLVCDFVDICILHNNGILKIKDIFDKLFLFLLDKKYTNVEYTNLSQIELDFSHCLANFIKEKYTKVGWLCSFSYHNFSVYQVCLFI